MVWLLVARFVCACLIDCARASCLHVCVYAYIVTSIISFLNMPIYLLICFRVCMHLFIK